MKLAFPGRRVEWFDTLDSTMTVAARLARENCPHGTVVGADEQTAGIGRHGHSWHSERGTGLYISMVLRLPALHQARPAPVITLALGLATQEAIELTTGLAPDLRWPNDVLLGSRKLAGILAQMEGDAVIAGIGVNVGQTEFPPDLDAVSLRMAGSPTTREDILEELIPAVERWSSEDPENILVKFEASSSYARNRRVRVDRAEGDFEGVTQGLDSAGFLVVRSDDGRLMTVLAGGVRPCS